MLYTLYDYGNEIIQAPGYVVIRSEMVHETRVIPTDGRPHTGGPSRPTWGIRWAIGKETRWWWRPSISGRSPADGGRYTDAAAMMTERFTAPAPDELIWEGDHQRSRRVDQGRLRCDIRTSWIPEYKIYEYACHEGNYMMLDALRAPANWRHRAARRKLPTTTFANRRRVWQATTRRPAPAQNTPGLLRVRLRKVA